MICTAERLEDAALKNMDKFIIKPDDGYKGEERCYRVHSPEGGFYIDYEVPGWQAVFTLEEASLFICKMAYKRALKRVMEDYLKGDINLATF